MNPAGFDRVYDRQSPGCGPLFLEIDYYFGRRAPGGSMAYYRLLRGAARRWLKSRGLERGRVRSRPRYSGKD